MPSAASLGFSTKGLSVVSVKKKCRSMLQKQATPQKKKDPKPVEGCEESDSMKTKKKAAKESDSINISSMDPELLNNDNKDSSSSTSTTSTSSTSSDAKEVTKAGMPIRPEFPRNNIRRWTTPGSRFPTPVARPRVKCIWKAQKIDRWISTTRSSVMQDCKADEKKPWPVPKHRRRTKSFRYLDELLCVYYMGSVSCTHQFASQNHHYIAWNWFPIAQEALAEIHQRSPRRHLDRCCSVNSLISTKSCSACQELHGLLPHPVPVLTGRAIQRANHW